MASLLGRPGKPRQLVLQQRTEAGQLAPDAAAVMTILDLDAWSFFQVIVKPGHEFHTSRRLARSNNDSLWAKFLPDKLQRGARVRRQKSAQLHARPPCSSAL